MTREATFSPEIKPISLSPNLPLVLLKTRSPYFDTYQASILSESPTFLYART